MNVPRGCEAAFARWDSQNIVGFVMRPNLLAWFSDNIFFFESHRKYRYDGLEEGYFSMEDTVLFLDEKKRSFFCQIFRIVVAQFIISGEMRRGRGKFEKKRERQGGEGEREEESQSNHMIQWSIRNPKEGWSPFPHPQQFFRSERPWCAELGPIGPS